MHVHGFQDLHLFILQMIQLMGGIVDMAMGGITDLAPYKRGAHDQQGTRHHENHPDVLHPANLLYLSSFTRKRESSNL